MAATTINGSTVVFSNSTAAANTGTTIDENAGSYTATFDVLALSGGGAKATLYSLDNGTAGDNLAANPAVATNNGFATYDTDLLYKDTAVTSWQAGPTADLSAQGAHVWIGLDGKVHYDASNIASTINALGAGEHLTDTFNYTIRLANGTLSVGTLTVTLTGENDLVSITSADGSGAVVEDANTTADPNDSLNATGTINFTDADLSDGHTASAAPVANQTSLGTFSLDPVSEAANAANGSVQWHYALDNDAAQYLAQGQSVIEHYTVTINDGHGSTVDQDVAITISGTEDPVSITSADDSDAVAEDGVLNASGTINFTDPDLSDGHTASAAPVANQTSLGTFSLDPVSEAANAANGSVQWHYALDNGAAQSLQDGETLIEHYTVTISDGHGSQVDQDVAITITGVNDAATFGGADTGSVTEDATLTANGVLTTQDVDHDETGFVAVPAGDLHGTYGDFTFTNGTWAYALRNGDANVQALTADDHLTDTLIVHSIDGTAHSIVVTVNGANEAPSVDNVDNGAFDYDTNNVTNQAQVTTTQFNQGNSNTFVGSGGAETIVGTNSGDTINAQGGNDIVYGRGGVDVIQGQGGHDTIYGGSGNDIINGGGGPDDLWGGSGNDTFVYSAVSDSSPPPPVGSGADTIHDFHHGYDRIDVHAIDANTSSPGQQDFTFNGTTATANGIWYTESAGNTLVHFDTNGNTATDEMTIQLTGTGLNLTGSDFILH